MTTGKARAGRRVLVRLQTLHEINRAVSASLDPDTVLATLTRTAADFFRVPLATVWVADDSGRWLLRRAAAGETALEVDLVDRLPFGQGTVGWIAERRMSVISADVRADEGEAYREWALGHGLTGFSGVPLVVGERFLGVLTLNSRAVAPLTGDEVAMLQAVAAQAAIAVENARLFAEARQRAAEYRALFEVGGLVGSTLDVERVLDVIVERCRALMGVAAAGIFKLDVDAGWLVYQRGIGLSPEFVERLRVRPGEGTSGRAIQERAPVWSADLLADPAIRLGEESRALVLRERYRAVLSVPILIKGEASGALAVYWWEPHAPTASEIELMSALAGQAAVALESARLYQAAANRGKRLATLTRLTETLTATLSLEDVLTRVAQSAVDLFGSSVSRLWLVDEDGRTLSLRAHAGASSPNVGLTRLAVGEGLMGRIVETRAPLVVADLREDARVRNAERIRAEGAISFAGVPLMLGDRVLGALSIAVREARPFSDEDLSLLQSLSDQAAIALDNARLFEAVESRAARLRTLGRLNQIVSSSLDSDEVLGAIANAAAELMAAPAVSCWVADEATQTLEVRAFSGGVPGADFPLTALPYAQGGVGWVARHRRALEIPDVSATEAFVARAWAQAHGLTSFLGVPIVLGESLLGVLALNGRRPFRLGPDDHELLDTFVAQAAGAIRNAGLYADTRRRLDETRALLEVVEILNSTLEPKRLLRQVAIKIAQVCRVDRCTIEQWQGDQVIPLMSQFADGRRDPALWAAFVTMPPYAPREVPAHAEAIETRRPVVIQDTTDTTLIPREWIETYGHKSYMVVPLIRQGEVIGVMNLDHCERVCEFQPWQVDLAMAIAGQLALSLENSRLYAEAQERLRETGTLLAVGQALSQPDPPPEGLRRVAREVAHAFGADMAAAYAIDERKQALVPLAGYHVPKHLLDFLISRPLVLARFPWLAAGWRERGIVWTADAGHDPGFDPEWVRELPPHSVVFAPTLVRDEPVGGLFLVWWSTGRVFSRREIRLIQGVASQVGLAMQNAELARQTQRKVEELSVLHELSRAVTGQLDQAGLIATVHQQLARVLDARQMLIILHDEERDELQIALRIRDGARDDREPRRFPARGSGLMSVVLETRRPLRTDDYAGECARRGVTPAGASVDLGHWLGVPMAAGDQMLGVLALRSAERAFTETDQRLLGNIADLVALALRSARLFEERTRAYVDLAAAQDQLVRTEKLRALGEMASGVAHDFNNLLASIVGRAQLLLQEVPDPKLRRWIEVIERSALDGAQTVRRLQEFTRTRRDQPFVAVDLNRVVQEALEVTESRWREEPRSRGIAVEVKTALVSALPRVAGDPAELREALTNLILNALDAMPAGGVLTLATSTADGQVELVVTDTGVGIPEPVRQKIFDPFFTTKGPRGTGLGLSMTYGILSRHGAGVAVESEQGHGTTFRLRFPVAVAPEPSRREASALRPAAPLRCLVVDDEEAVGDVLGDVLVSLGHGAEVLRGGAEAVARFRAAAFDVVFTDLSMPGLSGWEVARAIKALAPEVPVFLVTGFGVEVAAEELKDHGVQAVLAKPLRIPDVVGALSGVRPGRRRVE